MVGQRMHTINECTGQRALKKAHSNDLNARCPVIGASTFLHPQSPPVDFVRYV